MPAISPQPLDSLTWGPIGVDPYRQIVTRTFRWRGMECVAILSAKHGAPGGVGARCGPLGAPANFRADAKFQAYAERVVASMYAHLLATAFAVAKSLADGTPLVADGAGDPPGAPEPVA